jgi:dihydroneopterin aldolase
MYLINEKLYYLEKSKNGHSEDIISYIDYYNLYQDIKKHTQEEKHYTVNTLIYSYNSICNTDKVKACENKIKFIQDMLKYMSLNDLNSKNK